jgi:hypothetical protein
MVRCVRVALLFIDGVGIGAADPEVNPLAREGFLLSQFHDAPGEALPGGALHRVDPRFDVPGRPQSASNQTAMLTGLPAPKLIGRHLLGFPNAELRALIDEASVVKRLVQAGRTATFANSYPAGYLDALGLLRRPSARAEVELSPAARRRIRPSATTCAFAAAEVPLRTLDDLRAGHGLTHDVIGLKAKDRFDLPQRSPEEAAEIFWRLAEGHDFTLFEHYLADEAGHAQDFAAATHALATFDAFAREILRARPEDACVLICSDHGNVEDLSTRSHTQNDVALLSFGAALPFTPVTLADVGRLVLALAGVGDAGALR